MKYKYRALPFFLFFLFFLFAGIHLSSAKDFSFFSLSNPGGVFPGATSTVLTPSKDSTLLWSFHSQNLANGRVTSETTRIHIPRNRTLYVVDIENDEQIHSFSYDIESPKENNFFRVFSLQSNPAENFVPTLTVENDSIFPFSLKDWKLIGENNDEFSFPLPDEEMESGEKRTFILPLQIQGGTVQLISPSQRVKDKITYPALEQNQIYQRTEPSHPRDVRPAFQIITE